MKKLFITNSINSSLSESFRERNIDILDRKILLKSIKKIDNTNVDINIVANIATFELIKEFIIRSNLNYSFNFKKFYKTIINIYIFLCKKVENYDFVYIEEDYHIISSIVKSILIKKGKSGVIISRSLKRNITTYKIINNYKEFKINDFINYDNYDRGNDIFLDDISKNKFLLDKNIGLKRDLQNFMYFELYYNLFFNAIFQFFKRILVSLIKKIKQKNINFILDKNLKYIFLPLQTLYDSHNLFSKVGYDEMIDYILNNIKDKNIKLIIKEHPLQAFEYSFKNKYINNKNIIWLDRFTKANTIELLEKSILNLTLNSTAGLESIYLDKPTYVFGEPFYYDYRYASYLYGEICLGDLLDNLDNFEKEYKIKRKKFRIGYYENFLKHSNKNNLNDYLKEFDNLIKFHWKKIIKEELNI